MMEPKKPRDFLKFCEKDIYKWKNETDPAKKSHLLRRINIQMYAEACKQNYDDYTICNMLSADLDEYSKQSTPMHQTKFEELMTKLNINFKPNSIQSTMNAPNLDDILKSKKCTKTCKNDVLLNDLDKFFNRMKQRTSLNTQKPQSKSNDCGSIKMATDENGDLVFDMEFRKNMKRASNNQYRPINAEEVRSKDNQSSLLGRQNENTNTNAFNSYSIDDSLTNTAFRTNVQYVSNNQHQPTNAGQDHLTDGNTAVNSFNPFSSVKRKLDIANIDNFKRPSSFLKTEENRIETNLFARQNDFITANEELNVQYNKKYGVNNQNDNMQYNANPNGGMRRSLGGRRTINNKFVPPFATQKNNATNVHQTNETTLHGLDMSHPRLKNVDEKMKEAIMNEIVDKCDLVDWDCIAGLEYAKRILQEAVVLPLLRPDIFTGLRQPPRGVLLFGPPGTGKTLIGKCIASQSNSTFFSISASSLTSKWIGEGEKMVRALFAVAAAMQPSVVFIDEVDSLLCQRSESEHESSRRLKTEFLVQLDGTSTTEKDRILIVGATNRPKELDEAARRRFVKRLYIPLPNLSARKEILFRLLNKVDHVITEEQFEEIAQQTDGHSGADMKVLCQEAVMGPLRSLSFDEMKNVSANGVRPVSFADFRDALKCVRASVSQDDLEQYITWNNTYGSGSGR